MIMIPPQYRDIFEKKAFGHIATLMPNGRIQNTPVLVALDGDVIKVSITKSRQKFRNLQADPRVTITIMDPENPFRYVEVRGKAELTEDENNAFVDSLARKYMGTERYQGDPPGEERVIVTIVPEKVSGN